MSDRVMAVGIGVLKEPAKGVLLSDATSQLVDKAITSTANGDLPVRLAILLASADWCQPDRPEDSVARAVRAELSRRLQYDVPLVGASMGRLFSSREGAGLFEQGLLLILLCSHELWAEVASLPNPYKISSKELHESLKSLSYQLTGSRQDRIGASSKRYLLTFFPGFFLDKRGQRAYRDNELYQQVLEAFNHGLPVFGASAADDLTPTRGYQFANDECLESGLAVAYVETDVASGSMMSHGFRPFRSRRLRVDVLAGREDTGYDVVILDGKPAAVCLRELIDEVSFPLRRPIFGLPCGRDYNVIQPIDIPQDENAPMRLNRPVRTGDSLYLLNASTDEMAGAARETVQGAVQRSGASLDELLFLLAFPCTARLNRYQMQGENWTSVFRGLVQDLKGVPMAGGMCAGEFGLDAWNLRRSNNLSITVQCFANRFTPQARHRDLERKLVEGAGRLAVCETPKQVAELALRSAIACGATGGQICTVDYKLGRIVGLREPLGYADRAPEARQDWHAVLPLTDRPVPGPPELLERVPADLAAWAMPVSPVEGAVRPASDSGFSAPRDILTVVVATRHAVFILDSRKCPYCDPEATKIGGVITQIVIPLVGASNRVIATFQISFPDFRQIDREEFAFWVSFAQKVAGNLERAWEIWERDAASRLNAVAEEILHEPVGVEPWPRESCTRFLHVVSELTGAESLHLRTLVPGGPPGGEEFRLFAAVGPEAGLRARVRPSVRGREGDWYIAALRAGPDYVNTRALTAARNAALKQWTHEGTEEERRRFFQCTDSIKSTAVLPLRAPDYATFLGALVLDATLEYFFTERTARIVELAARLISVILRTRRGEYFRDLSAGLHRSATEWLRERSTSGSNGSQVWLRARLREACAVVQADWASLFVWHATPEGLVLHTAFNWFDPGQEGKARDKLGETSTRWLASPGKDIEVSTADPTDSARPLWAYYDAVIPPQEKTSPPGLPPRIALRLASGPDLLGVVVLGFYPRNRARLDELDSADYQYLREFARLMTLRILWMKRQADLEEGSRLSEGTEKIAKLIAEGIGLELDGEPVMNVLRAAFRVERVTFYWLKEGKLSHGWTSWRGPGPFRSGASDPIELQGSLIDVARGQDCTISFKEDPALATWPDADDVRTLYAVPAISTAGDVEGMLGFVNREQTADHPFPLFDPRERLAAANAARMLGSSIGFRQSVERRSKLLSQLQAEAETATTSVVAAMLSHDGARPINTIKKAAEYLERRSDLPIEERNARCREIIANCDQALGIFRSVVSGRGLLPSVSRVSDIVSQTLRVVRSEIPAGVRLEVSNEIQTLVRVRLWDIVNALTNVLTNALEAIDPDGTLSISTQESQKGKVIDIVVHNTGPNVTEDDVKKFFQSGYTTKRGEGRGLGLLIAKDHVAAAGGAISIFSPPPGGVTVVISLPVESTV